MLWKRLRNALLWFFASLLLLLASISVLLETETGSRLTLQLAARLLPLELGEVRGNLRSGLDISHLEYAQNGMRIRAEQASFRWRPGDLIYGALAIQSLRSQRLLIELPPSDTPKDPDAPPFDAWPNYLGIGLRIHLDSLDVRQIEFIQGDTQLLWESLSGAISLGTLHLRYRDLALEHKDYGLRLSGESDLNYPYHTQASIHWRAGNRDADPTQGAAFPYLGNGKLTGSLQNLHLHANSEQPLVLSADAKLALVNEQRQLILEPDIELNASLTEQQLPAAWWLPEQPQPTTSLQLSAQGNWLAYSAKLKGQLQIPDHPLLGLSLDVSGDLQQVNISELLLREENSSQAGAAPLSASQSGARPAALANASSSASASPIPVAPTPNTAAAPPTYTQSLTLSGKLAWAPELSWQLAASGSNLNLAQVMQDLPSQLQLQLQSQGQFNAQTGNWQLGINNLQASGTLRSLNLEAGGDLQLGNTLISSDGLQLVWGANKLELKGSLSNNAQLWWDLRAPMLTQLDPRLRGTIASQGQILGNLQVPQLVMTLDANDLAWDDTFQLDNLQVNIAPEQLAQNSTATEPQAPIDLLATLRQSGQLNAQSLMQLRYKLDIQGSDLHLGEQHIASLSLTGTGSATGHQLSTQVNSPSYGNLELGLKGGYDGKRWQGQLQDTWVKIPKVPRWELRSSQTISASPTAVELGTQCFTSLVRRPAPAAGSEQASSAATTVAAAQPSETSSNTPSNPTSETASEQANLCLAGNWSTAKGVNADVQLSAVPLRQLYALFKPEVSVNGLIDGSIKLRAPELTLEQMNATLSLATRNAELRYQYPGAEAVVYPWQTLSINGELARGQAKANLQFHMEGYGDMEASAQLNLLTNRIQQARLQAIFSNLAPIETFAPQLNDVGGSLRLNASASGPLTNPLISGELSLSDGAATLPQFGLNLEQIQVRLAADKSESVSLFAQVYSEKGNLNLTGNITQLGSPQWQARASLTGSDFRIISLPQLSANITPDIQLNATSEALQLTGAATIPWAQAHIKTLPASTTKVSADVIIIDDHIAQEASQVIPLRMDLRLILGKDVHFRGFGLNSKLSGNIQAFREGNRQMLTTGFVSVDNGTYRAYGQDLRIERGRLIFQGNYNNPGLDIRAYRTITGGDEEITAGLQLGGTLQRPNAKVYSNPSRSESEALLMLISGKPVKDASNADASLLLGILGGLAAGSSEGGITQNIANFFHVDEIGINADNGIEQSELWIGKQLTPKLMVRYMVGLFDNLTSLALQYQLNNRLRLEAESGEVQSVDLIYNFER